MNRGTAKYAFELRMLRKMLSSTPGVRVLQVEEHCSREAFANFAVLISAGIPGTNLSASQIGHDHFPFKQDAAGKSTDYSAIA
jgi:hypothetical protein